MAREDTPEATGRRRTQTFIKTFMRTENKRIETSKALLNWHILVQRLNAAQPVVERMRLVNGKRVPYYTRKKLITGSVEATGSRLIRDYIKSFNEAMRIPLLAQSFLENQTKPSMLSNCPKLGQRCNLSDRAIRNHINILKTSGVGLVSEYRFRGTFADFELWINPQILWGNPEIQAENGISQEDQKTAQNAANALPTPDSKNNLPLNIEIETHDTYKNKISNVDKGEAELQTAVLRDGTCDTSGHIGAQQASAPGEIGATSPVASAAEHVATAGGGAARKTALTPRFEEMILQFWSYAWKMLYPEANFSEAQQKLAKNAIWRGVYRGFHNAQMSAQDWESWHESVMERVDIAATYFKNNPDKYPPAPFPLFGLGTGYFDFENERGFKNTHGWLLKRQAWKLQQQVENTLRQARKEWLLYKKGKAAKPLQAKSPLELFRFHEQKVRPLGKDALQRFYAQHAIPQQPVH